METEGQKDRKHGCINTACVRCMAAPLGVQICRANCMPCAPHNMHACISCVPRPLFERWFVGPLGMFRSVIWARDRYLVKGGHMFPNRVDMYMAAGSKNTRHKQQQKIAKKWSKPIYGMDFSPLSNMLVQWNNFQDTQQTAQWRSGTYPQIVRGSGNTRPALHFLSCEQARVGASVAGFMLLCAEPTQ